MHKLFLLFAFISSILISFAFSQEFDYNTGNTSVILSAGAYCDRSTYLTKDYDLNPYSTSFVPTFEIYNKEYDVNGYIGYRTNDKTIYVVYEGSHSQEDWINDFTFVQVEYENFSCKVHKGFYESSQSVIDDVINEVKRLQSIYPSFRVVVTGHSLGAAESTLTAVDLVNNGINVYLMTFGSPRVFDQDCAKKMSSLIDNIARVTHYKDIVPHTPLESMHYMHVWNEWYEDNNGYIKKCDGYEDPTCSDQWKKTNGDDHMWYLGIYVGCNSTI